MGGAGRAVDPSYDARQAMSRLWERITSRGQYQQHQHAQLSSHDEHGADEDSELEAAFAGSSSPAHDNSTEVVFDAQDGSDRPYDAQEPYESHPLQAAGSSRRSQDQSSASSVASGDIYDFDLNPSQMRAAPSSTQPAAHAAASAASGGSAPSYEDPASASHRLRHVITSGLSSLASISRYGRLAQSDPDHHAASAFSGRQAGMANDGVFANLSAKPERRPRTQEGDIDYVGGDDENGSKEAPPVCVHSPNSLERERKLTDHLELRCSCLGHNTAILGNHHHGSFGDYGRRRSAHRRFAHRQPLLFCLEHARQLVLPIRWLPPYLCESRLGVSSSAFGTASY